MSARDLVYGPEKLRAPWRLLLFLVLMIAVLWILGTVTAPLLPDGASGLWAIAYRHSLVVVAAAIASAAMMRLYERKPFAALGFPAGVEAWRGWWIGAAIGGGLMVALVVLETIVGWLRPAPDAGTFLAWLERATGLALLLAVAAAAEELLFRGYAFQVLVEGAGVWVAVILSSLAFAGVHVDNPSVGKLALVNIALAGVLMAVAYLRTRSLWVAIGLHWGWNWFQSAVFDLPVSGIAFDVPGYDALVLGPDAMTGGAFGPEGGLLVTLLTVPMIVWTWRSGRLKESARMKQLAPLVDARIQR